MPESIIVDASAFDTPADIKPGVYSDDVFDKEVATPEQKEKTFRDKISKASEYFPAAGALVGGGLSMLAAPGTAGASLLGGSALAGLGAAAGKAGEQLVKRGLGEEAPKTSMEAAKEIGKEGAWTATINAAGGKVLEAVAPTAKVLAKQVLKGFARIDERAAKMVLNDPKILKRALPLDEAKEVFSNFFKNIGFEYGPKSVKAATGKLSLSDDAADDFISATIDKIGRFDGTDETGMSAWELMQSRWAKRMAGKAEEAIPLVKLPENAQAIKDTVQEALATRFAAGDAIKRATRSGNDSKAKLFIEGKNHIDEWLETQIPGFAGVRKVYEEAKIKKAFEPLLPLNKNKETSVLGVLTSLGSAVGAGGAFGPLAALPAAAISSPKLAGMAIKGAALATTKPAVAMVSELLGEKAKEFTDAVFSKGIETERKDHPTIPEEYLPHLVADELKADPNFYNTESSITPEEIKAQYKAGKLDKATAAKMLRENHGFR